MHNTQKVDENSGRMLLSPLHSLCVSRFSVFCGGGGVTLMKISFSSKQAAQRDIFCLQLNDEHA